MIKQMSLLKRKAGMSVEEFQGYWRDAHGPIAAKIPGVRRYIQSHTLPELYDEATPPDYDGVAELTYDTAEAWERAQASPEARVAAEDGRQFIGSAIRLLVTEAPLVDAYPDPNERQSMIKAIGMLMVKEGVPLDTFQRHWREVHGPINVKAITPMQRYVQSLVLPERFAIDNPLRFGGLPEHWYVSLDALRNRPRDSNAPRDREWPNVCQGQHQVVTREVLIIA